MFRQDNVSYQFCHTVSGNVNRNDLVDMNESKKGWMVVSESFSPCQAVFAKLRNGEYAVYHAASMWFNQPMVDFINLIKEEVEEVVVFEKDNPPNNRKKAPYLAAFLSVHLNMEVKRLHVENYTGIIADAVQQQVMLFTKNAYHKSTQPTHTIPATLTIVIHPDFISLTESIEEICSYNSFILSDEEIEIQIPYHDKFIIPKALVPELHEKLSSNKKNSNQCQRI